MPLTNFQLMGMRSLLAQGWPVSLLFHLLNRCSLDHASWQELVNQGWVEVRADNRYWLTKEGQRIYKQESKGKWF